MTTRIDLNGNQPQGSTRAATTHGSGAAQGSPTAPTTAVGDPLGSNPLTHIMLWLSGVDLDTLRRCPSEKAKFIGMGGLVLTTALAGTAAMTFTLHSFLNVRLLAAVPVAVVWGLIILNLDRWLVASTRRQSSAGMTLLLAAPRLALAVVFGLVIAEPLVLYVFDNEITAQATANIQKEAIARQNEVSEKYGRIDHLDTERADLEEKLAGLSSGVAFAQNPRWSETKTELDDLQKRLDLATQAVICEKEGTCGSGRAGAGIAYAEKERLRADLAAQVQSKRVELDALESEITATGSSAITEQSKRLRERLAEVDEDLLSLRAERDAALNATRQGSSNEVGLLDRVEALDDLTQKRSKLDFFVWLLRSFILAIDSLPVVVKTLTLLGEKSLYEHEQHAAESRVRAVNKAHDDAELKQLTTTVEISADQQAEANRRITEAYLDAQVRLTQRYLNGWEHLAEQQVDTQLQDLKTHQGPSGTSL